MGGKKTEFELFLSEEIKKVRGTAIPVRSGLLRRLLVRKAPCRCLHPNPDDEFCMPETGPNYAILSAYEQKILDIQRHAQHRYFDEPLIVERIRPDGYMLLNGHHRWAAAMRLGVPEVPVRIVNLTQEMDIKRMLQNARHEQRVTLDLEDVVFQSAKDAPAEKALPFPWNRIYPRRLRLGIPALFRFFSNSGYDIWVYTSQYVSMEDIRRLFRLYHLRVCGVVTGMARKDRAGAGSKAESEAFAIRYHETLHIDNDTILRVNSRNKTFEEYPLSGSDADWSREIMDIVGKTERHDA